MEEYRQKMQAKYSQDQTLQKQNSFFGSKIFGGSNANNQVANEQNAQEMQWMNSSTNNANQTDIIRSQNTAAYQNQGNSYQQNENQYINMVDNEQSSSPLQTNSQNKFEFYHKMSPNNKILFIANLVIIGLILFILMLSY